MSTTSHHTASKPTRGRGMVTKARYASQVARAANRAFRELLAFYRTDTDTGLALGVGRDTIAGWRESFPARPRAENTRRVHMLLAVCLQVEPYMADKLSVGDWTLSAQPFLVGETPAAALRRAGPEAVVRLTTQLADVVPRRQFIKSAPPSDAEFRAALTGGLGKEGMAEVQRMRAASRKPTSADLDEID